MITTAVTNLDLHDLGRLAATYDLAECLVIQPLLLQKKLVKRLLDYWRQGGGGDYNPTRKESFKRVVLVDDLAQARERIQAACGKRPQVAGTTARRLPGQMAHRELRERMQKQGGPWLLLFGTGWGVEPGFLCEQSDYLLEPISGRSGYNHLSVRTAAAIVVDRLLGDK